MNLTNNQLLALITVAMYELGKDKNSGLSEVEIAKVHVKLAEYIEVHGSQEQADEALEHEIRGVIRALYDELMHTDMPQDDCIRREAQMMKDAQQAHKEDAHE